MTTIYVNKDADLPERHANDLYRTEHSLIRAALDQYAPHRGARAVLDIGASDGRWGRMTGERTGAQVVAGVEITDLPCPIGFTHWYGTQDFRTWEPELGMKFDMIVGNPPYYCAEQIIRKAWTLLAPNGRMVMLLRLAFQAGVERRSGLWNEIYPYEVGVLSRRPSFYGGGTNGTDYALFFWMKDGNGSPIGTPGMWGTTLVMHEREKMD